MATNPVVGQREKDPLIVYRDCTLEDAYVFVEFAAQIACETNFTLHYKGKKYPIEKIQEHWQKALNSSSEFYLGAFDNGKKLLGQLYFHLINPVHPRINHIGEFNIAILKQYWGSGLAQEMMAVMEQRAKKMGAIRIEARVMIANERAVAFYRKLSYEIEGTRRQSINIDGSFYDEHYISKLI